MRVTVFSSQNYDRTYLEQANQGRHTLIFQSTRLDAQTAFLAQGSEAVCVFVNDQVDAQVCAQLAELGVRFVVLRCAGFNQVDLQAAQQHGLQIGRVPEYSPHAVAEHAVALMLTLSRKIHRATNRVREGNFALDGLMGFDLHGKTVGVVGTGKIGACLVDILRGFGCRILALDPYANPRCISAGAEYVDGSTLFAQSDIISLHCPLNAETHHLINPETLAQMRRGVMIINISRGAVIDTKAVIAGLKSGHIGSLGIDVYEEEDQLFFQDLSDSVIQDDRFARLLTFPNVVITGHQGFFTHEAMCAIAAVTMANLEQMDQHGTALYAVTL